MKKIYILLFALAISVCGKAQYVNAGMETWRNGLSGSSPIIAVHAPTSWYSLDSLIIALGEAFGGAIGADTFWKAQLFQSTTIKHAGSSAALLVTAKQDTLGFFAGTLADAAPSVDVAAILGGADPMSALSFSGGTNVTERVTSVSVWVEYFPGKDSATGVFGGPDSGLLTVQAYSILDGYDTLVGSGVAVIPAHSSWAQITAPLVYTDTENPVFFIRTVLASSGGANKVCDSSKLYADDWSMTTEPQIPQGVKNVNAGKISVYPNPASDVLYFDLPANASYRCRLMAMNGQVVRSEDISGKKGMDIHSLAAGTYLYMVADAAGRSVQSGKVNVSR